MSEEIARAFLARLLAIQQERGWSNARLSREIGISQSHISRLRSGEKGRRISLAFALQAAGRFPELRRFLLPSDVHIRTADEHIMSPDEEEGDTTT